MKKEKGNAIIEIIISILILTVIGFGVYKLIIGRDGIISKVNNVESEFDKTEVVEKLTELVKQKYMAVYNESKESTDKKLEDLYNIDIALNSLVEQGVMEYYYYSNFDENTQKYTYITSNDIPEDASKRDDIFWINTDNINDVKSSGKGKQFLENGDINYSDVFVLEKKVENENISYIINYYASQEKKVEVGKLELAQPLIK